MYKKDLDKTEIKNLFFKDKLTTVEIAQRLGVSAPCVQANFKRYGIKLKNGRRKESHRSKEGIELHKHNKWRCSLCGEIKNKNKFSPSPSLWMKHSYICKNCRKNYTHKQRIIKHWACRAYYLNHRAKIKFVTATDLELIWDKYKGKCYYCGVQLKIVPTKKTFHFDHVINGIDQKSNLVLACPRCNLQKGAFTIKELENMLKKIKEYIRLHKFT